MVNYWDISSGKEEHKVLIFSTAYKRIIRCTLVIAPALLLSSVAFAAEAPKLLTFEECQVIVSAAETAKATTKTARVMENARKFSSWGANFEICRHAAKIGAEGTKGTMTKPQMLAFSILFMLCGGFITLHVLEE